MSTLVVGLFTLHGTDVQNERIRPMAERLSVEYGNRVAAIDVLFKPSSEMPPAYGGTALGLWRDEPHDIWLDEDIDEYAVAKTFAHEGGHAYDDDWFNRAQRQAILPFATPRGRRWADGVIGGRNAGPAGFTSEAWAEVASVIFGGFKRPAYPGIFLRRFPRAVWPQVRELALRDFGAAEPEPVPPPPVPTPPDPTLPLIARIAELEAANTELLTWQLQVRGVVCP